ncbi:MAG: hypothetical protein FD180_3848 [Planctomycetota bacterium]|nr:MAG: hypothetical protein FD180_3848 [Planctomycetota bacterium]
MPRPRTHYALLRLDPSSPTGDALPRATPTRFFRTLAEARREARFLNSRAREWENPWRWRCRRAKSGEERGLTGF